MLTDDTNKCKKENGQENEKQGVPAADAKTKEQPGGATRYNSFGLQGGST